MTNSAQTSGLTSTSHTQSISGADMGHPGTLGRVRHIGLNVAARTKYLQDVPILARLASLTPFFLPHPHNCHCSSVAIVAPPPSPTHSAVIGGPNPQRRQLCRLRYVPLLQTCTLCSMCSIKCQSSSFIFLIICRSLMDSSSNESSSDRWILTTKMLK